MRRALLLFSCLTVFVCLGVLVPARPAFANTADDVIDTAEKAAKALTALNSGDLDSLTGPDLAARIEATAEETRGYVAELESLAEGAGDVGFAASITELALALDDLADALSAFGAASATAVPGDPALMAAANEVQAAGDRMAAAGEDFDAFVKAHPIVTGDRKWLLWTGLLALSVLCLLVAVVICATNSRSPAQTTASAAARKQLLTAGVLFAGGATVTAVQYWNVEPGETYRIFWYPMALGALWFAIGLPRYFAAAAGGKRVAAGTAPARTSTPGMTDPWNAGVAAGWQGASALSRPLPPPLDPNLAQSAPNSPQLQPLSPGQTQFGQPYPSQQPQVQSYPGQAQAAPVFPGQPQATPVFPGQPQAAPVFPGQAQGPQGAPTFPGQAQQGPQGAQAFPGQPQTAQLFPGQPQSPAPVFPGQPQAAPIFPGRAQAAPGSAPVLPGQTQGFSVLPGQTQATPVFPGQPQAAPGAAPVFPGQSAQLPLYQGEPQAPRPFGPNGPR